MKSNKLALFFAASLTLGGVAWGQADNRSYVTNGDKVYAQSFGAYQTIAYDKDQDRGRRDADNKGQDQREWKALLERQKDERQACLNNRDRDDRARCRGLSERQKDERQNFKNRERRDNHSQNWGQEENRRGDRD